MQLDGAEEFAKRLCPHRGIGRENTLAAIRSGITAKPFLVEFDVQWHDGALYLGHPPDMSKESTLAQVFQLFADAEKTFPKVDIKLTGKTLQLGLDALIREVLAWSPRRVLVNISGGLPADQYMKAETLLVSATGQNTLLNIDLERYQGKSRGEIITHVEQLGRKPFSISSNLASDIAAAVDFALKQAIPQLHFWAFPENKYPVTALYEIMRLCLDSGLEVYFDIRSENIVR